MASLRISTRLASGTQSQWSPSAQPLGCIVRGSGLRANKFSKGASQAFAISMLLALFVLWFATTVLFFPGAIAPILATCLVAVVPGTINSLARLYVPTRRLRWASVLLAQSMSLAEGVKTLPYVNCRCVAGRRHKQGYKVNGHPGLLLLQAKQLVTAESAQTNWASEVLTAASCARKTGHGKYVSPKRQQKHTLAHRRGVAAPVRCDSGLNVCNAKTLQAILGIKPKRVLEAKTVGPTPAQLDRMVFAAQQAQLRRIKVTARKRIINERQVAAVARLTAVVDKNAVTQTVWRAKRANEAWLRSVVRDLAIGSWDKHRRSEILGRVEVALQHMRNQLAIVRERSTKLEDFEYAINFETLQFKPTIVKSKIGWLDHKAANKLMHALNGNIDTVAVPTLAGVFTSAFNKDKYLRSVVDKTIQREYALNNAFIVPTQYLYGATSSHIVKRSTVDDFSGAHGMFEPLRHRPRIANHNNRIYMSEVNNLQGFYPVEDGRNMSTNHETITDMCVIADRANNMILALPSSYEMNLMRNVRGVETFSSDNVALAYVFGNSATAEANKQVEPIISQHRSGGTLGNRQVLGWEAASMVRQVKYSAYANDTASGSSYLRLMMRLWQMYIERALRTQHGGTLPVQGPAPHADANRPPPIPEVNFVQCQRAPIHVHPAAPGPMVIQDGEHLLTPEVWREVVDGKRAFFDLEGYENEMGMLDVLLDASCQYGASGRWGFTIAGATAEMTPHISSYAFSGDNAFVLHYGQNTIPFTNAQLSARNSRRVDHSQYDILMAIQYLCIRCGAGRDAVEALDVMSYRMGAKLANRVPGNAAAGLRLVDHFGGSNDTSWRVPSLYTAPAYFDIYRKPAPVPNEVMRFTSLDNQCVVWICYYRNLALGCAHAWTAYASSVTGRVNTLGAAHPNRYVRTHFDWLFYSRGHHNIAPYYAMMANAMAHMYEFTPSKAAFLMHSQTISRDFADGISPYFYSVYNSAWLLKKCPEHEVLPSTTSRPIIKAPDEFSPGPLANETNWVELTRTFEPFKGRLWVQDGGMVYNAQHFIGVADGVMVDGAPNGTYHHEAAGYGAAIQFGHTFRRYAWQPPNAPAYTDIIYHPNQINVGNPTENLLESFMAPNTKYSFDHRAQNVQEWGLRDNRAGGPHPTTQRKWYNACNLPERMQHLAVSYVPPVWVEAPQIDVAEYTLLMLVDSDSGDQIGMTVEPIDKLQKAVLGPAKPYGEPTDTPNVRVPAPFAIEDGRVHGNRGRGSNTYNSIDTFHNVGVHVRNHGAASSNRSGVETGTSNSSSRGPTTIQKDGGNVVSWDELKNKMSTVEVTFSSDGHIVGDVIAEPEPDVAADGTPIVTWPQVVDPDTITPFVTNTRPTAPDVYNDMPITQEERDVVVKLDTISDDTPVPVTVTVPESNYKTSGTLKNESGALIFELDDPTLKVNGVNKVLAPGPVSAGYPTITPNSVGFTLMDDGTWSPIDAMGAVIAPSEPEQASGSGTPFHKIVLGGRSKVPAKRHRHVPGGGRQHGAAVVVNRNNNKHSGSTTKVPGFKRVAVSTNDGVKFAYEPETKRAVPDGAQVIDFNDTTAFPPLATVPVANGKAMRKQVDGAFQQPMTTTFASGGGFNSSVKFNDSNAAETQQAALIQKFGSAQPVASDTIVSNVNNSMGFSGGGVLPGN